MKQLVLEKDAIRNNISVIREKTEGAALFADLTGDGHGGGLLEMAAILREEGFSCFGISQPEEAEALRKAGFVDEEIIMLRSTTDQEELEQLIDLGVICTIGSHDAGVALNGIAEGRATVVEAHIQVDTGMGCGGFLCSEPEKVLTMYRYLPNVALSGIHTRLSATDSQEQLAELAALLDQLHNAGFETGMVHADGNEALRKCDFAGLDGVRVGSALLGRGTGELRDMIKVGYGEARLEEVNWLPKGHTVSCGGKVTLKQTTRVAILPVGYQNGFGVGVEKKAGLSPWHGSKNYVWVGGQKVRVLDRIGAAETLLDVTDLKCASGDVAVFEIDPLFAKGLKKEYR